MRAGLRSGFRSSSSGEARRSGDGEGRGVLAWTLALVIFASPQHHVIRTSAHRAQQRSAYVPATPRAYARRLTLSRWHSLSEWYALDAIVRPESGWNPCAHYPGQTDCRYSGENACGIPQAYKCPAEWRGRLWATRWAQVRWLIAYVARRYGAPRLALAYRSTTGTY